MCQRLWEEAEDDSHTYPSTQEDKSRGERRRDLQNIISGVCRMVEPTTRESGASTL